MKAFHQDMAVEAATAALAKGKDADVFQSAPEDIKCEMKREMADWDYAAFCRAAASELESQGEESRELLTYAETRGWLSQYMLGDKFAPEMEQA